VTRGIKKTAKIPQLMLPWPLATSAINPKEEIPRLAISMRVAMTGLHQSGNALPLAWRAD